MKHFTKYPSYIRASMLGPEYAFYERCLDGVFDVLNDMGVVTAQFNPEYIKLIREDGTSFMLYLHELVAAFHQAHEDYGDDLDQCVNAMLNTLSFPDDPDDYFGDDHIEW